MDTVISDKRPRLVIIGSGFYQFGTLRMIGELLQRFPKLNIAVVSPRVQKLIDRCGEWPDTKSKMTKWKNRPNSDRKTPKKQDNG